MRQPTQSSSEEPTKRGATRDHRIKLLFVAVIVVIILFIVRAHRTAPVPASFPAGNLDQALQQAHDSGHLVVVLFQRKPPTQGDRDIKKYLDKPKNREAIRDGNFIALTVQVSKDIQAEINQRYNIKTYPTLLLLNAKAEELNRREGVVGEVDFRKGFLDRARIIGKEG